jgi:hypothetical protein
MGGQVPGRIKTGPAAQPMGEVTPTGSSVRAFHRLRAAISNPAPDWSDDQDVVLTGSFAPVIRMGTNQLRY